MNAPDYTALAARIKDWGVELGFAQVGIATTELGDDDLAWFVEHEWAQTAEDILWRRTKLGLHAGVGEAARVSARMAEAAGLPAVQKSDR